MTDCPPLPALDINLRPEAVIAGTLCLMSCYVQHPVDIYAKRVAANLAMMAGLADLSPELRTICRRLAQQWDVIVDAAQDRAVAGVPTQDTRALH